MENQTSAKDLELLVFELAGVRYALELPSVREVVHAVLISPLPDAPSVIEGVIDVRGELVPVYDLRDRFGLPGRPLHPDERLVIAWTGERLIAFRCDLTEWVEGIAPSLVEAPDAVRGAGRHIAGVVRLEEGLVLIQNLREFLDAAEGEALAAALSGLPEPVAE